jgi:sulfite exporter TauE/SafE
LIQINRLCTESGYCFNALGHREGRAVWRQIAEYCGAEASTNAPLLLALFLAGLSGGTTHCVGMCGPFVLGFSGARALGPGPQPLSEWRRLSGAALVPYHLGRATTYLALGVAAALVTGGLTQASGYRWIAALPLLATAAAFALIAVGAAVPSLAGGLPRRYASGTVASLAGPFLREPLGWRGYGAGVALGFLPCGLVYAAVAAAASTGVAPAAALGMLAFTLGTVPGLVAVAWLGALAARRFRAVARYAMPPVMAANAVILSLLAWRLLA